MKVLQEQVYPNAKPGAPFVVHGDNALQLADGYFYSCYDVCDWTTGCTKVCGVNACPIGATDCSAQTDRHTHPLYRIQSRNPQIYKEILEQRGIPSLTTNDSIYVPVDHVKDYTDTLAEKDVFVKQLTYLDTTNNPTIDGMMTFQAPENACVRMTPCTGPASATGVCCGSMPTIDVPPLVPAKPLTQQAITLTQQPDAQQAMERLVVQALSAANNAQVDNKETVATMSPVQPPVTPSSVPAKKKVNPWMIVMWVVLGVVGLTIIAAVFYFALMKRKTAAPKAVFSTSSTVSSQLPKYGRY